MLVAQLTIGAFFHPNGNRVWAYGGALIAEILFLATETFWMLAIANLLLFVAGIWNIFFAGGRQHTHARSVVRSVLYRLLAIVTSVCWIVNLYAPPLTKPVTLPHLTKGMIGIDQQRFDSTATMLQHIEIMNSFGSRVTGSPGHNQFIAWLKQQLTAMGLTVHRDQYTFDRWQEKHSAIIINDAPIHTSSAFPYSGQTDKYGVTAELVYTKTSNYAQAQGKIAVVNINNFKHFPLGLVMNRRESFRTPTGIPAGEGDLVLTTALKHANLQTAKQYGVKAVILVWNGVSNDKIDKQYLPFTEPYAGIPAVWVNETEGQKVIRAAQAHQAGTVILEAEQQHQAVTESFYVKIEGKNKQESIIINTHTDGVNVIEENGAIGMLSMIRYLQQQEQPERTLIFAFVTGHFRLPEFKGTSQATSTWMQAHPELWDGKHGHVTAVAGMTAEHLGSLEWKDNATGTYESTGQISTEFAYTGNEMMSAIWKRALADRHNTRTVMLRGHNKFQFGESQPLFNARIPMIGLIPMPDYLLVDRPDRAMDKFDIDLMHEQVGSLLKALQMIDHTATTQLGKADRYSFFVGNTH